MSEAGVGGWGRVGWRGQGRPRSPCRLGLPDQARAPPLIWGLWIPVGGTLTLQIRKEDPSSAAPTADASVLWGGESVRMMLPGQALALALAGTRSLASPPLPEREKKLLSPWGESLAGACQLHT